LQLEEELLESCPYEHNIGNHVDECQKSDVWKGSCPSSLGQVDNRIKETLSFTIKEPEIPHFHSTLLLSLDGVINNAASCGVVNVDESWWL
jgi:hypothetical protein